MMNDETTRELPKNGTFEDRVLAELAAIRGEQAAIRAEQAETRKDIAALDSRLTSLEERVDIRLRETQPIWEAVKEDIKRLDMKFDEVIRDLFDVRTSVRSHEKRLWEMENRPRQ
jgi:DNA-binding ferritin-like protein